MKPTVIIHDSDADEWLSFSGLREVFCVYSTDEVVDALAGVEQGVRDYGLWATGWVSYEASSAFDAALETHAPTDFPLLWMALFEQCNRVNPDSILTAGQTDVVKDIVWSPDISPQDYADNITRIKHQLAEGNSYQVNYTFRQTADMSVSAEQVFLSFASNARYGAFIETNRFSICSASPELFFEKHGEEIRCRPMKGTAARGRFVEEDLALRDDLAESEKNRAENLMIVDMIRNDLGKIASPGSVKVSKLFTIEKYPTVWQMTSTVSARCRASLVDIFSALFPCASITGAPKANTMKIIRQLEPGPRQLYTGTIGFIRPDMSMQFNVAIRSLLIDRETNQAEYGVGGGIVWDSDAKSEYQECLVKSKILSGGRSDQHHLLETMLWKPETGYYLLDYHLHRLSRSAEYFDYPVDRHRVCDALDLAVKHSQSPQRVRLLVDKKGELSVAATDFINSQADSPYRLFLAEEPVDENNTFLFHKTTERSCYEKFSIQYPGFNDVLLQNGKGEITESIIANLVVEIDGEKFTPPQHCGLLAGTYRQYLLDNSMVSERIISRRDLETADKIYLINSVRKRWQVSLEF